MDLMIVADPADRLAIEFAHFAEASGYSVEVMNLIDASRFFTIMLCEQDFAIEPDVPLFIRLPNVSLMRRSSDSVFHYGECFAALWSASALLKSTVINRPGPHGFIGRWSPSTAVTEQWAGIAEGRLEVFSSHPPFPPQISQQWWLQDIATGFTSRWPEIPNGEGPYRARPAHQEDGYEFVTVVGSSAWRATTVPLEDLSLVERSVSILQALELSFGVVIWSLSEGANRATLARVNPFPSMEQVQYVWTEISDALLRILGL